MAKKRVARKERQLTKQQRQIESLLSASDKNMEESQLMENVEMKIKKMVQFHIINSKRTE